jgi:hypothetical protein
MPSGFNSRHRHALPPKSRSGLKGVIYAGHSPRKPWKAYVRDRGEYRNLGYYATKEEAARVYNLHALRIHGPSTYFNPLRPCPKPLD